MTKHIARICALLTIAVSLFACLAPRDFAQGAPAADPSSADPAKIRIGSGDLLDIQVFNVPDMTQTVRVSDGGDASVNLLGPVHLAGLTIQDAQATLAQKFSDGHFLVNPQVAIMVREYVTQGVSVLGQVEHPGVYPVLGRRTVFDVLAEAGGITQAAGNKVSVTRATDGSEHIVALSGQKTDSLSSDLVLEPGDKIVVPRAGIVYVIGDVNRPGGFVMQNDGHLTLLQAFSMAMGGRRTASLNSVRLIRKGPNGYIEKTLQVKKVLTGKEQDQPLQADDILWVPTSVVKAALFIAAPNAISAATSTAASEPIYGTGY
jgi:polysaccharide export outer membrane protein